MSETAVPEVSLPATTQVVTSVVTASASAGTAEQEPVTVVITRTSSGTNEPVLYTYTTLVPSLAVGTVGEGPQPTESSTGVQPTDSSSSSQLIGSSTTITPTGTADAPAPSSLSTGGIAAISVCVALAFVISIAAGWYLIRRRRKRRSDEHSTPHLDFVPTEKDGNPVSELSSAERPGELEGVGKVELYVQPAELDGNGPGDGTGRYNKRGGGNRTL